MYDLRFRIYEFQPFQRATELLDVLSLMTSGNSQTQSGLATRDGWIADSGNKNSLFTQRGGGGHGCVFIADGQGNDRARQAGEGGGAPGVRGRPPPRKQPGGGGPRGRRGARLPHYAPGRQAK